MSGYKDTLISVWIRPAHGGFQSVNAITNGPLVSLIQKKKLWQDHGQMTYMGFYESNNFIKEIE